MYILICEDFNYDLLRREQVSYANEFLNNMYSNFLQPCITEPTRVLDKNRPTLTANILATSLTDHLPNFLIINYIKIILQKEKQL